MYLFKEEFIHFDNKHILVCFTAVCVKDRHHDSNIHFCFLPLQRNNPWPLECVGL